MIMRHLTATGNRAKTLRGTREGVRMTDCREEQGESVERLQRVLRDVEGEIRGLSHEVAYIISPDGTVIARREGAPGYVDLTSELMRGCIVTHNHPLGTSLSVEDVRTLIGTHAAEMRVVTDRYTHSLRLPPDAEWEDVELLVEDIQRRLMDEFLVEIRMGHLGGEEAEREYFHRVWSEVAEIRGWDYRREER